jgi:hypothetical protein
MALKQGAEHYTMLTFTENGQVRNRRLQRIEIQDSTGRMHILEGKALPDFIRADTGLAEKGEHLATILLQPEKAKAKSLIPEAWPTNRDVLNGLAGMVLLMMMLRFAHLASNMP